MVLQIIDGLPERIAVTQFPTSFKVKTNVSEALGPRRSSIQFKPFSAPLKIPVPLNAYPMFPIQLISILKVAFTRRLSLSIDSLVSWISLYFPSIILVIHSRRSFSNVLRMRAPFCVILVVVRPMILEPVIVRI